jgi:putative flippase GtrA
MVVSNLYTRLRGSKQAGKLTKYAIGSVIALVTSIVVFALMYVVDSNTTLDSVIAFLAGAVPNWILNRRWAWGLRGKVNFWREVFAYVVISALVLAASSWATGWASARVHGIPTGYGLRAILVTAAYVAVQAFFFAVKYLIYEYWVFAGRSRVRAALRSRHQVWTAARANRTP